MSTDPESLDPRGIASLLDSLLDPLPFPLSSGQIEALASYLDQFHKWNLAFSFSTARSIRHFVRDLVIPSLLFDLFLDPDLPILDLGSGPGIPGIPLSILRPTRPVSCLEASDAPIHFLNACRKMLALSSLSVVHGRAEDLAHDSVYRSGFHSVVAKAFAPISILIEIASAFVEPGGSILLQASSTVSSSLSETTWTLARLGTTFDRVFSIHPDIPDHPPSHFALFFHYSVASTAYPRTWKQMKKRPLWI